MFRYYISTENQYLELVLVDSQSGNSYRYRVPEEIAETLKEQLRTAIIKILESFINAENNK